MKTSFKLSLIAILATLLPAMAEAQGRTPHTDSAAVGGDVGIFLPSDDELEPALSLDGFYEYYLSPARAFGSVSAGRAPSTTRDRRIASATSGSAAT